MGSCSRPIDPRTRNFSLISDYIENETVYLHDIGFDHIQMKAAPSIDGGEIVVSGFVKSEDELKILSAFLSWRSLNPHLPSKMISEVKIQAAVTK